MPCLESWGERVSALVRPSADTVQHCGLGLTCGVVPHHEEEGSVHDDLLRGHSGRDSNGCKRRDNVSEQREVGTGSWT